MVPPPKASLDDSEDIPEATAPWWSILTFGWITPLMSLGYARPLEASDLYKLQDDRASQYIAERIIKSFERRQEVAAAYNKRLANGEISPGMKGVWWSIRGNRAEREKQWREKDGRKRASLVLAMNDSIAWWFWSGGILKLLADISQVLSPLLVRVRASFRIPHSCISCFLQAIIQFSTDSYRYVLSPALQRLVVTSCTQRAP